MKQKFIFLTILFAVVATTFISAQSETINLQGVLREANGLAAPDGTYDMTFNLYYQDTGGTSQWMENHPSVVVKNGLYAVYLGETTPLTPSLFSASNGDAYIGLTVGGAEMSPRVRITYSPFNFTTQNTVSAETVECSGAVGDVKYSILNPTQFATVNGDCWVPMDGSSLTGTTLNTITSQTSLPDASGLFLRAHEYNEAYDEDRSTSSPIATVQTEAFKSHNHTMEQAGAHTHTVTDRYFDLNSNGFSLPGGGGDNLKNQTRTTSLAGDHTHNINNTGGSETRPDNLNLYIYIRVN